MEKTLTNLVIDDYRTVGYCRGGKFLRIEFPSFSRAKFSRIVVEYSLKKKNFEGKIFHELNSICEIRKNFPFENNPLYGNSPKFYPPSIYQHIYQHLCMHQVNHECTWYNYYATLSFSVHGFTMIVVLIISIMGLNYVYSTFLLIILAI